MDHPGIVASLDGPVPIVGPPATELDILATEIAELEMGYKRDQMKMRLLTLRIGIIFFFKSVEYSLVDSENCYSELAVSAITYKKGELV